MARIFLSHASEDKAQVRGVYHRLRAIEGFEPVWVDWSRVVDGAAHCRPKVVALHPPDLVVTGTVESPYPADVPLVVVGCGGFTRVAPLRALATAGSQGTRRAARRVHAAVGR